METRKYDMMIILQSILYGIMDIVSKQAYGIMSVYCFLFLRYILAALLMLLIWRKDILKELKTVSPGYYIVPGLCMSCAFIFSNLALRYTAATNMSFIRSLSALIAPLLLLIFYRQKYGRKEPILQIFMLLGLYLLCAKGGLSHFGIGEIFALIAATLVAGSLVFGKDSLRYINAKTLSFVQTVLAIFFCGIMAAFSGSMTDCVYIGSAQIIFSLIYAAVGCTIGGYMLQNIALTKISARRVGIFQCLYPVATAVIAFMVLGEKLSFMGMIGAFIIVLCVFLQNLI